MAQPTVDATRSWLRARADLNRWIVADIKQVNVVELVDILSAMQKTGQRWDAVRCENGRSLRADYGT